MRYRDFGSTGMKVSEVGFGAWAIGGKSYGAADRQESLRALAQAEELGCNFVDTAEVYGDSERVLGEFLKGRRDRWFVATKYSGQEEGLLATAERQLERLGLETIAFYQIHWAPGKSEGHLYEELYRLKESGKALFIGVSLRSAGDIDHVLDHTRIDGFQVPFSLMDPDPCLARLGRIREKRVGIVVRSALKEGFLTGKYTRDVTFTEPNDQRHEWGRERIIRTVEAAERFRFLEKDAGSMTIAAARYPLSFPETSTVILGTRTAAQAKVNFGRVPGGVLSDQALAEVQSLQQKMGLRSSGLRQSFLRMLRRFVPLAV